MMDLKHPAVALPIQGTRNSTRSAGGSGLGGSNPGGAIRNGLVRAMKSVYLLPHVGIVVRGWVEKRVGRRDYQDPAYWNESLAGWASAYLGGTLSVDLRNSITMLLARRISPGAESVLDLGCAGATLAGCLDRGFTHYCGVDISEVAISKAAEDLKAAENPQLVHELHVSTVEDYHPSRRFDVIVFNEVMYYMDLDRISASLRHYQNYLSADGVILVSLKDHEQCWCVQAVVAKELEPVHAILFQEQARRSGWRTVRDRENPAFLVQAFRPRNRAVLESVG